MKTHFLLSRVSSLGFVAGLLAMSTSAQAAGTALDVQSARGTGMAGATAAFIDDSSAIFFNPAGIAQGKGLDAQAGINFIIPSFKYTDNAGTSTTMKFGVVTPFQVYAAYGLTDTITAGVGIFNPYGLDYAWPDGWAGRHILTRASFRTYNINPTLAGHFGPVRLGIGLQVIRATVELQKDISFGSQDGSADIAGGSWGVGANGGIQVEAVKKYLQFGATYRSVVKNEFDSGKAHFENVPVGLQSQIHDQRVSTSLTNPDQVALGVATHPVDDLVVDFDVVWYGWGKFHSIDINFPDDASGGLSSKEAKNFANRVNYHLGAEGKVHKNFKVRGGVLYDPSPSPPSTLSPDLPDANRLNLAIGGTYAHESGFHVDLGYQFLFLLSHKSSYAPLPGEYGGNVNILGLTIGYTQPRGTDSTPPPPPPMVEPPAPADGASPPASGAVPSANGSFDVNVGTSPKP